MECNINFELKNVNLLYYDFDIEKNIFYKKKNKSDFYLSKELLIISNLLEKNSIKYEVDVDKNVVVKY